MIEEAVEAFLSARFVEARSLLAERAEPASRLLLIRTLMRLNAIGEAARVAAALESETLEPQERGELLVLRYGLAIRAGIEGEIEPSRSAASEFVRRNDNSEIESEFWFFDAYHAFSLQDLKRCEHAAWDAIHCDLSIAVTSQREPNPVAPISNSKARALQFLGLVRGSQGRFHEQARFLREAVVTLRRSPRVDVYVLASLYMNLAFQARDLGSLDEAVTLEIIETRDWPASLGMMKLEIGVALAWLYALRGDDERALAAVEAQQRLEAPPGNVMTAIGDLAAISRACLRRVSYETLRRGLDFFERSVRLADPSQWFSVPMLAREVSYWDPVRAAELLDEFERLPSDIRTLVSVDSRSTADLAYAKGIVAVNRQRSGEAIAHLNAAFDIWVECGFRWQAAMAALEIAKAAPAEGISFWRYAQRESQNYPDSWLARDVASMTVAADR